MPRGRYNPNICPGAKFGLLTVVERIPRTPTQRSRIKCKCDCGNESIVNADSLIKTKSCGCQQYEGLKLLGEQRKQYKIGQRFGRLIILQETGKRRYNLLCKCDCGRIVEKRSDLLVRGTTRSCGCLDIDSPVKKAILTARNKANAKLGGVSVTHKLTHKTWRSLLHRIKFDKNYEQVKVCRHLWNSPWGLIETIGDRPTVKHTLDRFPVHNGNYTCGQCEECRREGWQLNVRWATMTEQNNNKGKYNVLLTAFGKTLTHGQWATLTGLDTETIRRRLLRGWSEHDSVSRPDKVGNCYKPELVMES